MTTPFVSVIVPVYNDAQRLAICLEALDNQTYPCDRYEVIVVDNGSTDQPIAVVEKFRQASIIYEATRGSYAARNRGIASAQGSVLAFTDSDCIPAPNWLEKGVYALLSTPNCGLVGGKIQICFQNPDMPNAVEVYDSIKHLQQQAYITETKFGATANLFTSKGILTTVGNFNPDLQSGGDQEWGQRVFAAGYKLVYAEDACIAHPARHSLSELYKKLVRVTKGKYNIGIEPHLPLWEFLKELATDLKPHFGTIAQECNDYKLRDYRKKLEFALVLLFVRYAKVWSKIQARLTSSRKNIKTNT